MCSSDFIHPVSTRTHHNFVLALKQRQSGSAQDVHMIFFSSSITVVG